MFQPHGAVDVQCTAALAARMALDVLLCAATTSRRRVWQGSRDDVIERGGKPAEAFEESFMIKDFPWHFE
jgi:hypothetical protein